MIVMIMLAFFATTSHFFVVRKNRQYEQSRLMIVAALLILAIHYLLQMTFKFREQGDDVGALSNILFYAPAAILFSCSQLNIQLNGKKRKKHIMMGLIGYCLILTTAVCGVAYYNSLHIGPFIYLVNTFNTAIMFYYVWMPYNEIRKIKAKLDDELGNPAEVYSKTMRIGSFLIYIFAIISPLFILSTKLLFIFGPIGLIIISFFVVSFTALGFNNDITEIIDEMGEEKNATKDNEEMLEPRIESIEESIRKWKEAAGYRDQNLTLATMTRRIMVNKNDFTNYLNNKYEQTFRVWLSDVRTEEAKRMMIENPDYSNELISIECGFSSRVYFQRMFKEKTGLTPSEWKKKKKSLIIKHIQTRVTYLACTKVTFRIMKCNKYTPKMMCHFHTRVTHFFYTLKRENNIFYYICIILSRTRQIESKSLFALVCKVFAIYLRIHI